jgi:hypothetical protein
MDCKIVEAPIDVGPLRDRKWQIDRENLDKDDGPEKQGGTTGPASTDKPCATAKEKAAG